MSCPDKIALRPAAPSDATAVAACTASAYGMYLARLGREPQPMTADYEQMVREHQVWLAEAEGACIGVLVLMAEADHLLVYSVAVDPAHQGRGLGRRLMALAEAEARRRGFAEVQLYSNALMAENLAFYAGLGYRETARRPHPEHKGSTLVFMSKRVAKTT